MKLILIGCGGHGRVILDIARLCRFRVVGFVDDDPGKTGTVIHGTKVLGTVDLLPNLPRSKRPEGVAVAVGDNRQRARIFARVREMGFKTPHIIHPEACVASRVELGEGVVIMAGAILNPGSRLGINVCVNTGAQIDHDCILHDHAHVYPGAILTGGVEVGEYAYIGSGAVINPCLRIGRESYVGSGAVVIRDVPARQLVAGIPARKIRLVEPEGILAGRSTGERAH